MTQIRPNISEQIGQITSSDGTGKDKSQIDTKHEYDKLSEYLSGNYEELNTEERRQIRSMLDGAKELFNNIKNSLTNKDANAVKDAPDNSDDKTPLDNNYDEQSSNEASSTTEEPPVKKPPLDPGESQKVSNTSQEPKEVPNPDKTVPLDPDEPQKSSDTSQEPMREPNPDKTVPVDPDEPQKVSDTSQEPKEVPNPDKTVPVDPDEPQKSSDTSPEPMREPNPDKESPIDDPFAPDETKDAQSSKNQSRYGKHVVIDGVRRIVMPDGKIYDLGGRRVK